MTDSPLQIAIDAWTAGNELRTRRRRYKNYTYGRQWDDLYPGRDGRVKTEYEFASECGYSPLTNNLLRQMVKTIVGLWRRDMSAATCGTDAEIARRNSLAELDARMLEEYLISGCAVQRVTTERRVGGTGVWVDNVSPERFFVSPFLDPRGSDIEAVGMIHDFSLREAAVRFGGTTRAGRRRIENIYAALGSSIPSGFAAGADSLLSSPAGRCRAIELWTLESCRLLQCFDPVGAKSFAVGERALPKINAENRRRDPSAAILHSFADTVRWRCRWLAPDGETLDSYLSPWPHASHPFAVKFYPLTDGEVHPFVEDVIDQQRSINRLITQLDSVMRVAAKGALLYPTDCIPCDIDLQDIADRWSIPGALIPYQIADSGDVPRQINGPASDCGANSLLQFEMKLFDQISGVNSALQGRDTTGNTSAALYDARTRNATTSLVDVLESFASFVDQRNSLIKNC